MIQMIFRIFPDLLRNPKIAFQDLKEQQSKKVTVFLVILFGFTFFIERASTKNLGDDFSMLTIFIFALVLGPLLGLISWLILSSVSFIMARLLGGTGTWAETRIATTWSTLPYISKWIILFFQLIMFRSELFKTETPIMDGSLFLMFAFLVLAIVDMVFTFFYLYVFSNFVAEVHDFSAWKGLLSVVLLWILLILLLIVLAALF